MKGGVRVTEHQSGLRFDIYERVHLDESLAGIQELDEIEMIPHIQVLQEGEQAVLKGNLWLTGTYLGDSGEESRTLEHFIPVEITLPMNRIHRLEDIAVEIENFDIDVLSARSLNVTGVLSLHGIEMTSKQDELWKEEEEFVVVHRAEDKDQEEVQEGPADTDSRQSADEEGAGDVDLPSPDTEGIEVNLEEARTRPQAVEPEFADSGQEEPQRPDFLAEEVRVEPEDQRSVLQDGDDSDKTETIAVSFRSAPPERSMDSLPKENTEQAGEEESAARERESYSWSDSFFTSPAQAVPDSNAEESLEEASAPDEEPYEEPAESSETATAFVSPEVPEVQQPSFEPNHRPSASDLPSPSGSDRTEGITGEKKAEEPVWEENKASGEPVSAESNVESNAEANVEANIESIAEANEEASAETNEEAVETIAVSMPEEKQELKIAFGKKSASEASPSYNLANLIHKTDIIELESPQPEMREQTEAGPPSSSDGVEWKRLFSRTEDTGQQFKRMRMCIVQKEETIETIAERYKINPREIILYNRLGDQQIEEGQVLYIP